MGRRSRLETIPRRDRRGKPTPYISRWKEPVRFLHGGPENFTYEFTLPHMTYSNGTPMQGHAAYAEIVRRTDSAERDDAGFFITLDEFAEIVSVQRPQTI